MLCFSEGNLKITKNICLQPNRLQTTYINASCSRFFIPSRNTNTRSKTLVKSLKFLKNYTIVGVSKKLTKEWVFIA